MVYAIVPEGNRYFKADNKFQVIRVKHKLKVNVTWIYAGNDGDLIVKHWKMEEIKWTN